MYCPKKALSRSEIVNCCARFFLDMHQGRFCLDMHIYAAKQRSMTFCAKVATGLLFLSFSRKPLYTWCASALLEKRREKERSQHTSSRRVCMRGTRSTWKSKRSKKLMYEQTFMHCSTAARLLYVGGLCCAYIHIGIANICVFTAALRSDGAASQCLLLSSFAIYHARLIDFLSTCMRTTKCFELAKYSAFS